MARQHLIAPFITTIALGTACGTEVTVLHQGEGGSTSSGGGSSPATSGSGGQLEVCPPELPFDGAPCQGDELLCSYEDFENCIVADAYCTDERWVVTYYDIECNPPRCPFDKPEPLSSCAAYPEGMQCWYSANWPCPDFQVPATCVGQQWQVDEPRCNPPPPDYCYTLTSDVDCDNTGGFCRWREPGCGADPLPQAGCFPAVSCLDAPEVCTSSQTCTTVSIDPCWNVDCGQCHEATAVCL